MRSQGGFGSGSGSARLDSGDSPSVRYSLPVVCVPRVLVDDDDLLGEVTSLQKRPDGATALRAVTAHDDVILHL
jgi:hypothetical protein